MARATAEVPQYWVDERMFVLPPTPSDMIERPDSAARAITMLPPCPDTFGVLLGVNHTRVSDAGLLDLLEASERQLAVIAARQQVLLAEVARRDPRGENFLTDEAALTLKAAPVTTRARIEVATALMTRLVATHDVCETGELSSLHARILAEAVTDLDDAVTAKVQAAVLPRATSQTPGEFRAAVRKAVARFDTREQETKHKDAFARRRVEHTPLPDGMASVWTLLSADGAAALMAAINATATASVTGPGDTRTADQRRADALVELAHAALCDPTLPTAHGARPTINITVGLATLLGCSQAPATLEGYGPIPAEMARRLAADPTGIWRRLVTDEAGRLLDYADTTYQPPAALTRHVITRDGRCVMPGCRRKAALCDLDHRVPYPLGGTNAENLQALCRRHHRMKHHHGTSVTKNDDGSYTWTTPTGRRYRYIPETLPPAEPEPPPRVPVLATAEPPPF